MLWTELGVKPSDADDMTLDDALVAEVYAEEARKRDAAARARNRK